MDPSSNNCHLYDLSPHDIQPSFNLSLMPSNQLLNIATDMFIDDSVETSNQSDCLAQNDDYEPVQFCDLCNIVYYFNNFEKKHSHLDKNFHSCFSEDEEDFFDKDELTVKPIANKRQVPPTLIANSLISALNDEQLSSGPSSLSSYITSDTEDLLKGQIESKRPMVEKNLFSNVKRIKSESIFACNCSPPGGTWIKSRKYFGFQFKNFCSLKCLKLNSNIPSRCSFCHHDVNWKLCSYSISRYDDNLKYEQLLIFCDEICYRNHMDMNDHCYYCLKSITKNQSCLRIKHSQIYFCSMDCLDQYSVFEVKAGQKTTMCLNCHKNLIGQSLSVALEDVNENIFCSFMCRLSHLAKVDHQGCFMCDQIATDARYSLYCFHIKCNLCSKSCREKFRIRHRMCEKCINCGMSKLHSDMIELKSINTVHNYYCSVNCLLEDSVLEACEEETNEDVACSTGSLLMLKSEFDTDTLGLFAENDKLNKKSQAVNTCGGRVSQSAQCGGVVNTNDCGSQTDLPHIYPIFLPIPVIFPFEYSLKMPLIFCTINYDVLEKMFPFVVNRQQQPPAISQTPEIEELVE